MIRLGVNLPTFDPLRVGGPPRFIEVARLAEEAGFDAVWVGDHLQARTPVYEATVALAAVAATTSRVSIGFGVMLLGLRQPAWVAKQLATIDAIAPGRLQLGVGVGGEFPDEFAAVGASVKRRGRLLDDALAVLPDLLRGRAVETATLRVPALVPAISRLPPIWVGGRSEAALARAARAGDGWLATWMSTERLRDGMETLAAQSEALGRPCPTLGLALSVRVDANEGRAREAAEDYTQAMYGIPFDRVARYTPVGSAERIAEQIDAYAQAGVEEFVLTPLTGDPLEQTQRLAEVRQLLSRNHELAA